MISLYHAIDAQQVVLPHTLRECYEAWRQDELRRICDAHEVPVLQAILDTHREFVGEMELASFYDAFSFLSEDAFRNDPPGQEIYLPSLPYLILPSLSLGSTIASVVKLEVERLRAIAETFSLLDFQVLLFAQLLMVGLSDKREFSNVEDALVYIASGVSPKVKSLFEAVPALLEFAPLRRVVFPDMLRYRKNQLLELGQQFRQPFTAADFVCYSDDEVLLFVRDNRALALAPNAKHYAICERCESRMHIVGTKLLAPASRQINVHPDMLV